MGYLVQTQNIGYGVLGDKYPPKPNEWQTRSGYDSKPSAQTEAKMWRAKRNGRKRLYHVRVISD